MGRIRPAIRIQRHFLQASSHNREVIRGDQAIRIKDDKVISPCAFKTKIPREPLAFIAYNKVTHIQSVSVLLHNRLRTVYGTIFDDQYFKWLIGLPGQDTQKLIDLLWTVIQRN